MEKTKHPTQYLQATAASVALKSLQKILEQIKATHYSTCLWPSWGTVHRCGPNGPPAEFPAAITSKLSYDTIPPVPPPLVHTGCPNFPPTEGMKQFYASWLRCSATAALLKPLSLSTATLRQQIPHRQEREMMSKHWLGRSRELLPLLALSSATDVICQWGSTQWLLLLHMS